MIVKKNSDITLDELIQQYLKPFVRKIDKEAYYAKDYLQELGKAYFFESDGSSTHEVRVNEAKLVEETGKYCMTTAFNLWCHLAALTYLRNSSNAYLRSELLPKLESGEILGGTGLSNPLKHFADLEKLHLKATRKANGYVVSGTLPAVSNLADSHWFGLVAEVNASKQIMAFVPCRARGLKLKENTHYLGLNGSATYACQFDEVFIPDEWLIAQDASRFIQHIRPTFVFYQIPLGFGVTSAAIQSIERVSNRQRGANRYLPIQTDELENELNLLKQQTNQVIQKEESLENAWLELLHIRLDTAYLTSKSVHANMLHTGGAGYISVSDPARRLREAYFLINLTPTVRHLEKVLAND